MDNKQKVTLENWYVGEYDLIYDNVFGHPKLKDGKFVKTSRVVKLDIENNQAVTLNTNYVLGKPKDKNAIT